MPDVGRYSGKDQIAGTPTEEGLPANRRVGGLPEIQIAKAEHPTDLRRRDRPDSIDRKR